MKWLRLWRGYIYAGIVLIFLIGLTLSSESFENCEHNRKYTEPYKALQEKVSFAVKAITRLKLHIACVRVTAGENDGAVTALSGIAVAWFTLALWQSTEKLWRADQDKRNDFERSIRAAEASSSASMKQAEIAEQSLSSVDRPWIFFEISVTKVVIQNDGFIFFGYSLTVQNHGRTPAINVSFVIETVFAEETSEPNTIYDYKSDRERVTAVYDKAFLARSNDRGETIPSGKAEIFETGHSVQPAGKWRSGPTGRIIVPIIIVSVTYRSPTWTSDRFGQTAAVYTICKLSNGRLMVISDDDIKRDQPALAPVSVGSLSRIT